MGIPSVIEVLHVLLVAVVALVLQNLNELGILEQPDRTVVLALNSGSDWWFGDLNPFLWDNGGSHPGKTNGLQTTSCQVPETGIQKNRCLFIGPQNRRFSCCVPDLLEQKPAKQKAFAPKKDTSHRY